MESANQEIDGRPLPPLGEDARPKFKQGFGKQSMQILSQKMKYFNIRSRPTEDLGRRKPRFVQGKRTFHCHQQGIVLIK